jgi:acetyl-CoA C-acetyltransferase
MSVGIWSLLFNLLIKMLADKVADENPYAQLAICLYGNARLLGCKTSKKDSPPMTNPDPVVILSYARTPMGAMQGVLADASATELGAAAVKAAVERSGVDVNDIERIYMGCVLPAGLGQAPARQAGIKAGLPKSVQATTINKVCGSGMQTVIMGAEALASGSIDLIVAGGMESMTNAPYLLKKHRSGARIGHDTAYDHMFLDGLEDAYEEGRAMGTFAQDTANEYQLTREAQDDYAIASLTRAKAAIAEGAFVAEITPVTISTRKGDVTIDTDEAPGKGMPPAHQSPTVPLLLS